MASDDLSVDVGELPPGVFQKEFSLDGIDGSKHIHEQDSEPQEKSRAVPLKQDMPVGNEELQLTEQPKSQCQQQSDGYDESIGNHTVFPKSTKQGFRGAPEEEILIGERAQSRKAPEALQKCARVIEEGHR
jgi:hypothetical protein